MADTFKPIPSLKNLYEIDSNGVVRNAKSKRILAPMISFSSNKCKTYRTVASLLEEVHGIARTDSQNTRRIECSCSDGVKTYNFQCLKEMAKFLSPKVFYTFRTIEDFLNKRISELGGYTIKYFDEPKFSLPVEHGNFGKKYNKRRSCNENN